MYPFDFHTLDIKFNIGNIQIKSLDSNHGIFVKSFMQHQHSYYELHYITDGNGTLLIEDKKYTLEKGNLYLVGPNVLHEQLSDSIFHMREFHFAFDINTLKIKDNAVGFIDSLKETSFWYGTDAHEIGVIFEEIERELMKQENGFLLVVKNCLEKIILLLTRNILGNTHNVTIVPSTLDDRRYSLIEEYFLYSYDTITLESLSMILGLSYRQTQRIIKERYNMTFPQMRTRARLQAAANLLSQELDLKISEICFKTGFSQINYFNQVFKQHYGLNPTEYRKLHKR